MDSFEEALTNKLTGIVRSRSKPPSIASSPIERRESHADLVSTTLDQPATRAKGFRDGLLQRDGYCCVVTGDMDLGHWESLHLAPTEGAHIIPFSYATWDSKLVCSRISIWTDILTGLRTMFQQMFRDHGKLSGAVSLPLGP
jgi:hypothetical protein